MVIKKVSYKIMANVASPFQPWLRVQDSFQERFQKLNPYSIKSQANFCEFFVGEEHKGSISMLPDNTRSFIFEINDSGSKGYFRGINNKGFDLPVKRNTSYFIVRPISLFGMKGWKECPQHPNTPVPLTDMIITNRLEDKIFEAESFEEKIQVFTDHYLMYWADSNYSKTFEEWMAIILFQNHLDIKMKDIEEISGYSFRHCSKKFVEAYGVSPQQYAKVFRFQASLRMLLNNREDLNLSDIVEATKYFDEAHFSNDFKKNSGLAPVILKNKYQDQFKQQQYGT